jgi:hypothetical protein
VFGFVFEVIEVIEVFDFLMIQGPTQASLYMNVLDFLFSKEPTADLIEPGVSLTARIAK